MQLSLFQFENATRKPVLKATRASSLKEKPAMQDPGTRLKEVLAEYVPDGALEQVVEWLLVQQVQLRIKNSRSTKLGDYRPPRAGRIPVITVNHNLNPSAFLVTLVHEMAHHVVMKDSARKDSINPFRKIRRLKPHGREWQSGYKELMESYLRPEIFPAEVMDAIRKYLERPKASTTADRSLYSVLKKYDAPDGMEFLEKLPKDSVFQIPGGRRFKKGERVRTRYKCISLNNRKVYLFNPLARVFRICL